MATVRWKDKSDVGTPASGDRIPITDVDASNEDKYVEAGKIGAGQQTIWIPAAAMTPTTTNGAAAATEELATNDVMLTYLAFDDSTRENACFAIQMPKSWDASTLISQFVWKTDATSGNCIWGLQAVALADDDALDAAFGTAVEVTDAAASAADDCIISAESGALTVAGSPGAEEYVVFKVYRDATDTMNGDAELLGVKIHYTTNANRDD